jgi:ankyrin repeat protein
LNAQRLLRVLGSLRPLPGRERGLPDTLTGAASLGDVALMRVFLERGESIEERSIGFASPLCAACAAGKADAAAFLLERGAKLRPENAFITPMSSAVSNGHLEIVKLLLRSGATLEDALPGIPGACTECRYRMLKLLLDQGLDLDQKVHGKTLREACARAAQMNDHEALYAWLHGQPVDDRVIAEEQRARRAWEEMRDDIARESGKAPVALGAEREAKLAEAEALTREAGAAALGWADDQGEPVICIAAHRGALGAVKALLDAGADANTVAPHSLMTPLIRAAEGGHAEVARLLLARGADVNAQAAGRFTALTAAVDYADPELVRLLLEAGAKTRVKPADGRTAARRVRGPYAQEIASLLAASPRAARS